MSSRITLMSHSSTSATNAAAFAADEPLDDRGSRWAADARGLVTRPTRVLTSPSVACRQTADALGLPTPGVDPGLADWDLGRWRGRTLDDVAAGEPEQVQAWLGDPEQAPHGGETLVALLGRVAAWLDAVPDDGHTVAVTHAAVVRAAVVAVLDAPAAAFWRIDVAPLTATRLSGRAGRRTLRSTAARLVPRGGTPA